MVTPNISVSLIRENINYLYVTSKDLMHCNIAKIEFPQTERLLLLKTEQTLVMTDRTNTYVNKL